MAETRPLYIGACLLGVHSVLPFLLMIPFLPTLRTLALAVWGCLCCTSCLTDERYTTLPGQLLAAASDTLHFDTVMAGEPSSTRSFWLYNRGASDMQITASTLGRGKDSPFRVNIDGTSLQEGGVEHFEVRRGDSLRVFAFVIPPMDAHPYLTQDVLSLTFLGGATQRIHLQAVAQPMHLLTDPVFASDTLLQGGMPYRIKGQLTVSAGATLRLAPGVRLYFHAQSGAVIAGTLRAEGTATQPIVMRGDRLDMMFEKQPYARIPGQWGGIHFSTGSYDNVLRHCVIESGTNGITCDSADVGRMTLRLEHSIVHNMDSTALRLQHVQAWVGNSQITNAREHCVWLQGGSYDFVHTTIANFYPFAGNRGAALVVDNFADQRPLPLLRANVVNSIVTGYGPDEVFVHTYGADAAVPHNFAFAYSLLHTARIDTTNIVGCLWDDDTHPVSRDKNFTPPFDTDSLIFVFRPDTASQAVGTADYATSARLYPTDLGGTSRLTNGRSDMGAWQH